MLQNEFIENTGLTDEKTFEYANAIYMADDALDKDEFCKLFMEIRENKLFKIMVGKYFLSKKHIETIQESHKRELEDIRSEMTSLLSVKDNEIYEICRFLSDHGHENEDDYILRVAREHMGEREYYKYILNGVCDLTSEDRDCLLALL